MAQIDDTLTPEEQDAITRRALAPVSDRTARRPDLAQLYANLGRASTQTPDLHEMDIVSRARMKQSLEDQGAAASLMMLGGKHLAPYGRQLHESALKMGEPLRPNEADVGYADPTTGKLVESPWNRQRREEKALIAEIAGGERALSAEEKRKEDARKADEDRAARAAIAADRNLMLRAINAGHDSARADRAAAAQAAKDAKAQEVPQHLQQVYLQNQAKLGQVDAAIAQVKQNPDAVGAIGWLPEAISQYVPGKSGSEGVPVRAAVADLGSMKIHDRSGAAVTASEFPRLRPFIPNVGTDSPQTIQHKLGQFKVEYANMVSQIEQGYPLSHFIENQRSSQGTIGGTPQGGGKTVKFGDLK